jgi:hypothetical protein
MLFLFPTRSWYAALWLVQVIFDLFLFFEVDLGPCLFFQVHKVYLRSVFTLRKVFLSCAVNNMDHQVVHVTNIVLRRMRNFIKLKDENLCYTYVTIYNTCCIVGTNQPAKVYWDRSGNKLLQ